MEYLRSELDLCVPSESVVVMGRTLAEPGEYSVPLKISGKHTEILRVRVG